MNYHLQEEKRLILPKIENNLLKLYFVNDLENDLEKNINFNIFEPNPKKCKPANFSDISCVLIPGLAFDNNNHRLGYGKGYYDRLLKNISCVSIGIGFLEQIVNKSLPIEIHDIKLNHVMLF
ncbi:MAG: 5-formyltetrahydrofolate cyclo-ligase [Candidatus Anoxychlamydiales bacterium]|nr:5-formyltetrahydrofolate cyclo-ligase [Candidatus Anoxychlamydiales bacterium]